MKLNDLSGITRWGTQSIVETTDTRGGRRRQAGLDCAPSLCPIKRDDRLSGERQKSRQDAGATEDERRAGARRTRVRDLRRRRLSRKREAHRQECATRSERQKRRPEASGTKTESGGSVDSSALCGFRLGWIGRRGWLLDGDAGSGFGVQAEVGVWRGLELVDLDEHRVGVLRGGVESEMLRADVVIEEPWLAAVFSSARVEIHHVGLLGAGCDSRVVFRFVVRFPALEYDKTPQGLIVPPGKARDEREPAASLRASLRPSLRALLRPSLRLSLRRVPRLVLHAFVTYSNGLVNGDEIRKDCLHAGAGAEIEQSREARSNDCGKQNYDDCCGKNQQRRDDHQGFQFN